jgi:hypothetical protein
VSGASVQHPLAIIFRLAALYLSSAVNENPARADPGWGFSLLQRCADRAKGSVELGFINIAVINPK